MMIFVNLPVADLDRAIAFYTAVGATQNAQYSDPTAAMMRFSDTIAVMLLTHERFLGFNPKKAIVDAKVSSEVMLCITAASRADVDDRVARAGAAGGRIDVNEPDEYDFMYGRSFEDPDGHLWGVNWIDMAATAAMQGQPETVEA
ncbi:VOC family protein [Sphingomonas naphthae]|uniref:VOC family protein n=1 Tax=Sphingomonas naphthae TaxID=1813468 RepID=A0ABY7TM95_9SPHN|nr:VOC family protein [Sphingomonas naphthae]WCT73364.1 VOC family protein [Sphingomonas naphthae]